MSQETERACEVVKNRLEYCRLAGKPTGHLAVRLVELRAQVDAEFTAEMETLRRAEHRFGLVPIAPSLLVPMGMDEYLFDRQWLRDEGAQTWRAR